MFAGIVAGTTGDHPLNVYPDLVGFAGGVIIVPYPWVMAVTGDHSAELNVIV